MIVLRCPRYLAREPATITGSEPGGRRLRRLGV